MITLLVSLHVQYTLNSQSPDQTACSDLGFAVLIYASIGLMFLPVVPQIITVFIILKGYQPPTIAIFHKVIRSGHRKI